MTPSAARFLHQHHLSLGLAVVVLIVLQAMVLAQQQTSWEGMLALMGMGGGFLALAGSVCRIAGHQWRHPPIQPAPADGNTPELTGPVADRLRELAERAEQRRRLEEELVAAGRSALDFLGKWISMMAAVWVLAVSGLHLVAMRSATVG